MKKFQTSSKTNLTFDSEFAKKKLPLRPMLLLYAGLGYRDFMQKPAPNAIQAIFE
jgi:hypothetical protein